MIVDCHCHAGKGDGLTGPWDTAAPLEQHMRRAAQAGIDRTVIFVDPPLRNYFSHTPARVTGRYLPSMLCGSSPTRAA